MTSKMALESIQNKVEKNKSYWFINF